MSEMEYKDLSELQVSDFLAVVNDTFECTSPSQGALSLIEVVPLSKPDDPRVKKAPFTLVFTAPNSFQPQQGMFSLSHQNLGVLDIFLVPVAQSEHHIVLEATFT